MLVSFEGKYYFLLQFYHLFLWLVILLNSFWYLLFIKVSFLGEVFMYRILLFLMHFN